MTDLDKLFIPATYLSDKHPDKITMFVSNEYGLIDEFVYDWDGKDENSAVYNSELSVIQDKPVEATEIYFSEDGLKIITELNGVKTERELCVPYDVATIKEPRNDR